MFFKFLRCLREKVWLKEEENLITAASYVTYKFFSSCCPTYNMVPWLSTLSKEALQKTCKMPQYVYRGA